MQTLQPARSALVHDAAASPAPRPKPDPPVPEPDSPRESSS